MPTLLVNLAISAAFFLALGWFLARLARRMEDPSATREAPPWRDEIPG